MNIILAFLSLLLCVSQVKPAMAQKYESNSSRALTTQDAAVPAPGSFDAPLESLTRTSARFVWTGADATPDYGHKIYYYDKWEKIKDVSAGVHEAAIDGLTAGKRYSFSSANVKDGAESARSASVIVDMAPDDHPPNAPVGLKAVREGPGELRVSFRNSNRNMADFKYHKIYYGANPDNYSDITTDSAADKISLVIPVQDGVACYIAVSAYDAPRPEPNESNKTPVFVYQEHEPDEDGEDKGGCFIATAAFGSYNHPAVKVFRDFRDEILLNHNWGKQFVASYYRLSPKASKAIQDNAVLKISAVVLLSPALFFCYSALKIGVLWTSTLGVFLISSIIVYKWPLLKK